jgi:hypothetical protein
VGVHIEDKLVQTENHWLVAKEFYCSKKEFGFHLIVNRKLMKVSHQESYKVAHRKTVLTSAVMELSRDRVYWETTSSVKLCAEKV